MAEIAIVIFDKIAQGATIHENAGEAYIPTHRVESGEPVFRYRGSLIPRHRVRRPASRGTEEEGGDRGAGPGALRSERFLGRRCAKHGLRELHETGQSIEGDLRLSGAVTVIVRHS